VWLARHRTLGRAVAVKELFAAPLVEESTRQRFRDEARALGRLDHPHIVPVHDFVETEQSMLIVMELLPGGTVEDREQARGFNQGHVLAAAVAASSALHHAHRRGIVHRDVKPRNLLFAADDTLKIVDFGIAKLVGETARSATGQIIGSPGYLAPEQVLGLEPTPATDVYGLATTVYQLLSRQLPFDTRSTAELLAVRVDADPVPVTDRIDLDRRVAEVLMRGLARSPDDRPPSAEEFAMQLAGAATDAYGAGWLTRAGLPVFTTGHLATALAPAFDDRSTAQPVRPRAPDEVRPPTAKPKASRSVRPVRVHKPAAPRASAASTPATGGRSAAAPSPGPSAPPRVAPAATTRVPPPVPQPAGEPRGDPAVSQGPRPASPAGDAPTGETPVIRRPNASGAAPAGAPARPASRAAAAPPPDLPPDPARATGTSGPIVLPPLPGKGPGSDPGTSAAPVAPEPPPRSGATDPAPTPPRPTTLTPPPGSSLPVPPSPGAGPTAPSAHPAGPGTPTAGDASTVDARPSTPAGVTARIRLHLPSGETRTVILSGPTDIGRKGTTIVVRDPKVSRRHARLTPTTAGVTVEDLGSANGTYANGERLSANGTVAAGGYVTLGDTWLFVEADDHG
jgi:serine/threonine-protein kinase